MIFYLLNIARNNSWRACWPPGPPRIHSVHPNVVLHYLMQDFPAELQSWNQFTAFAEVPIWQCRVHLSHSQVQYEVFIGPELSCPCPIKWNMRMYSIVVVIYLVMLAGMQYKLLPRIEFPDKGLTIPYLLFPPHIRSVQLLECHPGGHNIHDILWFFEAKYFEWLTIRTILSYGLQHIHISNIFVRQVLINGISRYTLGPVFALLDGRSSVDTKLQQGCDPL